MFALGNSQELVPPHHLLFAEHPDLEVLVMTSGNVSDETLVIENDEAVERLGPLCDAILWHDRPIERCVDDSVFIDFGKAEPLPVRRSRGLVPRPLALPIAAPAGAAVTAMGKQVLPENPTVWRPWLRLGAGLLTPPIATTEGLPVVMGDLRSGRVRGQETRAQHWRQDHERRCSFRFTPNHHEPVTDPCYCAC